MSISQRSTTGCSPCKTKRKKCDETKPQCQRCKKDSGTPCVYEYVGYPENGKRGRKRTKPAPRSTWELLARTQSTSTGPLAAENTFLSMSTEDPTLLAYSAPSEPWGYTTCSDPNLPKTQGSINAEYLSSVFPATFQHPLDTDPLALLPNPLDLLQPPAGISYPSEIIPVPACSISSGAGFNLDEHEDDDDPEGVRLIICASPTMDKNVGENTLPFVLLCYSQWAITSVFEPKKIAHIMRDQVIAQFSSEDTRSRTILIANVMNVFAKHLTINDVGKSILDYLAAEVRESSSRFTSTPPSTAPTLERQSLIRMLESMLEIYSLQTSMQSIFDCLQTLRCAAPIFRLSCSEPPEQPIDLSNILLESNLNLRHFATIDIMSSVATGLPTYFQYKVPFSLELCEQIRGGLNKIDLQWLHGFPDQIFLLFAWINSLCETPGAGENSELIAWIEGVVPQITIAPDSSGDPLLRIGRMVVQECWRFAVLIYLYMALCNANAYDPRVIRAQKGFMRLVKGVKPARNPDAFLSTPMIMAGAVTIEEQDRNTLRQRMLGVRECAVKGTSGNNIMLTLEDVWARTKYEGRAAVWSDLRIASFRVVGR
ncbi:putative fungal Zn(2)-cys(6) binuclear cluster domain protein [Rhizoctonia solani 123E]|uniref:Putative fungal Zn(2)-cys(6) binuclear cluster domain protein n=1 Tax=Rhizoctonia solani 123E TaxID=1423351 RepID=A0A074RST8_9AGAM|nr:putative fungal Zn(2)-cys(6) binuclear cluster domain protein [Rhizoctonia solani 123E]